ncbi:hypothetical protein Fcan01_17405 [Folsomia candida]|uniref:Uncharacterized protein n=1 Tax=Folsomia candida TaxID=158441 RepID=A0A226DRT4_FOLCA|nr:hypothetical protein Fcan01_17405 [Folsomia candida]
MSFSVTSQYSFCIAGSVGQTERFWNVLEILRDSTTTTPSAPTTPTPDPIVDGGVYTIVNSATGQFIPNEYWVDSYWELDAVPGTQFHTIYQTWRLRAGNVRYTGWVTRVVSL